MVVFLVDFWYFLLARGSIFVHRFLIDVHTTFCFFCCYFLLKRGGGHAASLRFGYKRFFFCIFGWVGGMGEAYLDPPTPSGSSGE